MIFAFLGGIMIGVAPFTGPTSATEETKSTFARLNVAEGKPVLQDMGDDLATKKLAFYFDEAFCDPAAELANLEDARAARAPLPWSYGDGSYTGARYVVESINVRIKKTSASGALMRIEADLHLIEAVADDLSSLASALAMAAAPALSSNAGINVTVLKA